ncbi:MAG: M48 family metallopeptidase [Candidatus Zambryskibacteria bacterium]|nr:M48 family metallopeptidase [Candidatus Zambryskibacteria bacterium]
MMLKEIKLQERKIEYLLKISKRASQLRLTVQTNGGVIVTAPELLSLGFIERAVGSRAKWILEKIEYFKKIGTFGKNLIPRPRVTKKQKHAHYLEHKEVARKLVGERLEYFNTFYKFNIGRISIKNTKSRWGSCSRKGNLNFNYKIALLTPRQADYIIVHELCHLGQFNHSKKFWDLVAQSIPEYKKIHTELRKNQFRFT